MELHIRVKDGPPISSKYRLLDPKKSAATKVEFDQLERDGIIRGSDSQWASPLHMVRKPDGSWRPYSDYRRLNIITIPDAYPMPTVMDFSAGMSGCTIFSKVDLRKGYHKIPMNAKDICKTVIITPFGLHEFLCMDFSLRKAGNTFQLMMDCVARGMPFLFIYLDDIIVGSRDIQSHVQHLLLLFERLRDYDLVIKWEFGVPELDFLGHRAADVAPPPEEGGGDTGTPTPRQLAGASGLPGNGKFLLPVFACRREAPEAAYGHPALRGGKASP